MVAPLGGPAAPGTLADVEGLTDSYYDSWGKLQAYAKSMWLKNNIDVTSPDFSQPGGGLAFKTYQKLVANNMAVANKLGNQLKEQQQMRPLIATGQTFQNEDGSYTPTALLPEVQEAFKLMDGPFYSEAEAVRARQQIREQALSKLRARPDQDNPYIQNNIRALEGAGTTWQTHPYLYQQREDKTKATQAKAAAAATKEVSFLKRVTSIKNGFLGEGEHSVEERDGKMFGVSKALSGLRIDAANQDKKRVPAIIKDVLVDPQGNVQLTFEPDTETGVAPPPERIDNQDAADLTARLQQLNPRLGNSQKMFGAMEILGLNDEGLGLNEDAVFGEDSPQIKERATTLKNKVIAEERVKKEQTRLSERLDALPRWQTGYAFIGLPNGKNLKISKNKLGSSYNVEGLTDKPVTMSKEEITELVQQSGYYDKIRTGEATPTKTEDKAAELIRKYSK